jgi:hypothetical protein
MDAGRRCTCVHNSCQHLPGECPEMGINKVKGKGRLCDRCREMNE